MASLLFKEMKGVNFSCASPASAAVCTSIDHRSMVRTSSRQVVARRSPHLRDYRRSKSVTQLYQSSKPNKSNFQNSRMSTGKLTRLMSPPGSSRYLLADDTNFIDVFPDSEPAHPAPVSVLQPFEPSRFRTLKGEESTTMMPPSSASARHHQDQVVVLRVSLHCKGCEGKVRKHISKMEGVTSFSIDLAAKKVTVVGDVTPLGVLNSVSKVKNAQFWPSQPRASASF